VGEKGSRFWASRSFAFSKLATEAEEFGKKGGVACKVEPGEPLCIDPGCRGTAAESIAPPGVLCIYTQKEQKNAEVEAPFFVPLAPAAVGEAPVLEAYGTSGAFISGISSIGANASYKAYGTWAVTAPTS
jgi:hypothetical protein